MWTVGYKYSCRNMEMTVQNKAGCIDKWSVAYVHLGTTDKA